MAPRPSRRARGASRARPNAATAPRPRRIPPAFGQESVWDYPRPPAVEATEAHVEVWVDGRKIADSYRAVRVVETAHAPVYYLPLEDCDADCLVPSKQRARTCPFKGRATFLDLAVAGHTCEAAAWRYLRPKGHFDALADHVAFHPGRVERCVVDGEVVRPQAGGAVAGWVTDSLVGPFKGEPGSEAW